MTKPHEAFKKSKANDNIKLLYYFQALISLAVFLFHLCWSKYICLHLKQRLIQSIPERHSDH